MKFQDYIIRIVIGVVITLLLKQYVTPYLVNDESSIINKFLYNDNYSSVKPYLWLYVPLDKNSRKWKTFNERNTLNINQPYIEYCIKSILGHNKDVFNVCVICDDDMNELIDNWEYRLNELSEPTKERVRKLGKLEILDKYGGFMLPANFLCLKNIRKLYGEITDKPIYIKGDDTDLFLGSKKNNEYLKVMKKGLKMYIKDMTSEPEFNNSIEVTIGENSIRLDPKEFGINDINDKKIELDVLLGHNKIEFSEDMYGIYIPREQILYEKKHEWFSVESIEEIKLGSIYLSKYFN